MEGIAVDVLKGSLWLWSNTDHVLTQKIINTPTM